MTAATPARRAALDVLRSVRTGELADRALDGRLDRLPPRDRPWTQELVYGTLRLRGRLDHTLDRLVRRGIDSLEPDVLDVLRLGAYQLLEMGSVPAYAAVSQSVELAKAAGGRGADRLVNGVLQSLARRADEIEFASFEREPAAFLTTWGSHPRWLVERWIARYGADGAGKLVEANNRRPELFVRPIGLDRAAAVGRLAVAGIDAAPVGFAPDALRIEPPARATDALEAVPAIVQDPAAGLVVRYAAVPAGARVADLCAAPGGKAIALAESAGYVVASDVSRERMRRLEDNVARLGGDLPLGEVVADARRPPFRDAAFDVVLLDVPCTGTGTFRRHPDARWRVRPGDLDGLVGLQRSLLDAAAGLVAPGGSLVYATCSLEPEENEDQVNAFLERHASFRPDRAEPADLEPDLVDADGRLRVLPQSHGVDGAFAARLRRTLEA